jgi:hypothetical protein
MLSGQDQLRLCYSQSRKHCFHDSDWRGRLETSENLRNSQGQAAETLAHLVSGMVVQLFFVIMAVASAKEPPIAGRAAIRALQHHKVPEPIFDAASFRTKELFATAVRAPGGLSVGSSFLHGKSPAGAFMLQRLAALIEAGAYDCLAM